MGWTIVGLLDFLTKEDFEIVTDVLKDDDSWESCARKTIDVMGYAVGSVLVRKSFNNDSNNLVESMFVAIKEELKNNLNNIDWLDDETRLAAVEKLDEMIHMRGNNCFILQRQQLVIYFLGYPDIVFNPDEVDKYYEGLEMEADEYFLNNIRFRQFQLRQKFSKINRPAIQTM